MAVTLPSVYQDGTATVTSGGTVVTGQSTLWINAVLPGDFFGVHTGDPIRILSVDSNTQLTLANPYPGASQTEAHYEIMLQSDNGRMQETSRQLLETLSSGNNYAFSQLSGLPDTLPMFTGPGAMTLVTKAELVSGVRYDVQVDTLADRATYDGEAIGFTVLVSDVGDGRSAIYSKASLAAGDWTDPAYLTGPVGPAGPYTEITVGTTSTLPPGSDATVTPTIIDPDTIQLDFGIPRGLDGTGTGDVVGPSSAVDNFPAAFDTTSGKLIKQVTGAIAALHGVTPAADRLPYFNGSSSAALATFTALARSLLDDATGADMFVTMGATLSVAGSVGYIILPNNLKIMWGSSVITLSSGGGGNITLPASFATSAGYALVFSQGDDTGGSYSEVRSLRTASGFSVRQYFGSTASGAATVRVNWIAVGV